MRVRRGVKIAGALGLVSGGLGFGLFALVAAAWSAPTPQVTGFSPSGSVQGVQQIAIRFATPMAALGDPRLTAPVSGNCSAGSTGRWADPQNYVIDIAGVMPGGQRCYYTLVQNLKDADGRALTGTRQFAFDTGGPALRAVLPEYDQIAEDQVFLLALNAAPSPASVAAGGACLVEGLGERLPLDILPDRVRDTIVKGARGDWRLSNFLVAAGHETPRWGDAAPVPRAHIVAVRCHRPLPAGGKVTLLWDGAVTTANGLTAGETERRAYRIRPAFAARLECSRVNAGARCSPLEAMRVTFSGDVPRAAALSARIIGPDGVQRAPVVPTEKTSTVGEVRFAGPFAERTDYRIMLPPGLVDDGGRPLVNAARFPLAVTTGDFPPLAKFAGSFGIIEAAEGGVLPVTLRGVESPVAARADSLNARALPVRSDAAIAGWLRTLAGAEDRKFDDVRGSGAAESRQIETTRSTPLLGAASPARRFTVPRAKDPRQFEVVGIPLRTKGFHVVELASPALGAALLGPGRTRYVATGALVTDMAVHFQWGDGASLAFVTRLSDAKPVAGALVTVTNSCDGRQYWQGRTDASGQARVPAGLPRPSSYGDCSYGDNKPLMISARTADDMSFVLTSWGEGIQAYDFGLRQASLSDAAAVHAIIDRTLVRPGDTVNMKLVWRQRRDGGFGPGAAIKAPKLRLYHWPSDTGFDVPLAASAQSGTASWAVPASAPLGAYAVQLSGEGFDQVEAGTVQVDAFRLPAIRAGVTGPKTVAVAPTSVPIDLALSYLSGGAVAGAPVKLRTQVNPRDVTLPDYPDWSFGGEPVTPGIAALDGDGEAADAAPTTPTRARLEPVTLGAGGTARIMVALGAAVTRPSELIAEMDYDDANGEVATRTARIALEPSALRVGIRTDGWMAKSDDLRLKLLVLDLAGKPVSGARVKVRLFSRETYSYRKRLVGGFYAYDNSRETKELGANCGALTDNKGLATCRIDVGVAGEVIALAEVADQGARIARASKSVWLAGDEDWWFGGDNGDRMDLVPEAPMVAANGVARLQVRMPFREATALVSVLQGGVMDSYVTTLSGKDPIVEVQMKGHYAPNVTVSVLAVRGRVAGWRLWLADFARRWNLPWFSREAASPTALVDLAKPSFRLGMAKLKVGWDAHSLTVKVTPDRASYPVKAAALARIKVTAPAGRTLPADAEIAFAAVDEALLQLKPNESWKLLDAMMAERGLGVVNATAQTQVVGKRHYGRKAVAAGGSGGALSGAVRSDFNPLLAWVGRVKLDGRGEAVVPLRTNDSLSAFRMVAVATAGGDLFGTGSATVRTTQDLQLLAGIPQMVRSGDNYAATILVRNTTVAAMTVGLTGRAGVITLPPLKVTIPAGGARNAAWTITAPDTGPVAWDVTARAVTGQNDRVQISQTVLPAVPDQMLMGSFLAAGAPPFPVARPADALPGRGGIDVTLSRSIGGTLP
ncbi:alpha-2-macroglobulin family protein, partial [Sandarakinorhabdus sp.]|uniref:alpha-2-macroglobulin family protein n=1 Tax=Sandarakinorhabdus sp. TaxID=1916663 RepID=UPI00286E238F